MFVRSFMTQRPQVPFFAARVKKAKDTDILSITRQDIVAIETFIVSKIFVQGTGLPEVKPGKKLSNRDIKKYKASFTPFSNYLTSKERNLEPTEHIIDRMDSDTIGKEYDAKTYPFGFQFEIPNVYDCTNWENRTWELSPRLGDTMRSLLSSFQAEKTGSLLAYKGKVADFKLIVSWEKEHFGNGLRPVVWGFVGVKPDKTRFEEAFRSLNASGSGAKLLMLDIYRGLILEKPVPTVFTRKFSFENPIKSKAYGLPTGQIVFIPEMTNRLVSEGVDEIKEILAARKASAIGLPKNVMFFPDHDTQVLIGTDNSGTMKSYSLAGLSEPSNRLKMYQLDKPLSSLASGSAGDLSSFMRIKVDQKANDLYERMVDELGQETPIRDALDHPSFTPFIKRCIEYGEERYGQVQLVNWISFMGLAHTLKNLRKDFKKITAELQKKDKAFKACTPDSCPAIPNMNSDLVRFPHQAEALAKLDIAADSAILDVATGGGKANILIQDCINLLNKGLIRRPLIVMPNALIAQFLSEIAFFTRGTVNGFPLTTKTAKRRGMDVLLDMAKNAPLNTIFISTFSFLSKGGDITEFGLNGEKIKTFEMTRRLKNELGIDYVAVDESQNIKNMSSNAFQAVNDLGRSILYKRLSTGTLISNKPTDLIGQLFFLDPLLLGTKKDFDARYAIDGNPSNGYKKEMVDDVQRRLHDGSSYIKYEEKDWAPLLPKKVYSFERVQQTPEQAKVYKAMVTELLDEIKTDPVLGPAFIEMQQDGANMDTVPAVLLGKLTRLERYLSSPDSARLMKYSDANAVSVKAPAIHKLIQQSLNMPGPNNKVIVATHYKSSALHLMKHSGFEEVSRYYSAAHKDIIPEFQDPKSNVKVLFAVVQSLKEGLNLQIANRIIIADVDWTPGNLKQLEARIFRPDVKMVNGELVNKNKGKTVYIDTVIADDSADCVKFAFQGYKKIINAILMSKCPVDPPRKVPFTDEVLTAKFTDPIIGGNALLDKIDQYNNWIGEEVDAALQKGDYRFRAIEECESNIGTDIVDVPWVKGMVLPCDDDEEPLLAYLETLGADTEDEENDEVEDSDDDDNSIDLSTLNLKDYEADLINVRVRTEFGEGTIRGVAKKTVSIRLDSGERYSLGPTVVIHKKGSVGVGLTRREMKQAERRSMREERRAERRAERDAEREARMAEREARKEQRAPKRDTGKPPKVSIDLSNLDDMSMDSKDAKAYFRSKGIKYSRQKSASTGKKRCCLRYEDRELFVNTTFFKNLTLGEWKKFAEMLLNGKSGTFDPDRKALDTKSGKSEALSPTKTLTDKTKAITPTEPPKGKGKPKALSLDDEDEDDATINLDMDDDVAVDTGLDTEYLDNEEEEEVKTPPRRKSKALNTDKVQKTATHSTKSLEEEADDLEDEEETDVSSADSSDMSLLDGYLDPGYDFLSPDRGSKTVEVKVTHTPKKPTALLEDDEDEDEIGDIQEQEEVEEQEEAVEEGFPIPVLIGTYNKMPALISLSSEEEGEPLTDHGFTWSGPYWNYPVRNQQQTKQMLKALLNDYTVPEDIAANVEQAIASFRNGIYSYDFPEGTLAAFMRENAKKAPRGTLRLYPMLVGGDLMLVVDFAKHPGAALAAYRFRKKPGYYINIATNLSMLKTRFKKLEKAIDIEDAEYAKELAKEHLKLNI